MNKFYTILTQIGAAKLANATAEGTHVELTTMAIGDGNGTLPTPSEKQTALVHEVRRAPLNSIQIDDKNPSWIICEQVIPENIGGWTIREVGLFDKDNDLIAVGSFPETYKPILSENSSRTQTIRVVLEVSFTEAMELKIDPSVVLATREYVNKQDNIVTSEAKNYTNKLIALAEQKAEDARNLKKGIISSELLPEASTTSLGAIKLATDHDALVGSSNHIASVSQVVSMLSQFGEFGKSYGYPQGTDLNKIISAGNYFIIDPMNGPYSKVTYSSSMTVYTEKENSIVQDLLIYYLDNSMTAEKWYRSFNLTYNSYSDWIRVFDSKNLNLAGATELDNLTEKTIRLFSPANLKTALINQFKINELKNNGYQKFPGGMILQWGISPTSVGADANMTLSFPIAFPKSCLSAQVGIKNSDKSNDDVFGRLISTTQSQIVLRAENTNYKSANPRYLTYFAVGV